MLSIHGAALLVALVLNATANILMKTGATRVDAGGGMFAEGPTGAVAAILTTPALVIGLSCYALNVGFYMFALQSRAMKISIAYPLMVGGGYAIIATVGYLALGERLNTPQKIGVALILIGVITVTTQTTTPAPA